MPYHMYITRKIYVNSCEPLGVRAVLKGPIFCFGKDCPKGPPTANRQPPPTANRHQPLTADRRQPPTATNRQPSTAVNRHQPPITNCQLLPTAANHQPPTANQQSPPAANRQSLPTMVDHMSCTRSFLKKPCSGTFFFPFPLRTALLGELVWYCVIPEGPAYYPFLMYWAAAGGSH